MDVDEQHGPAQVYDVKLIRWIWTYVRPYRRFFFLSLVLMPLNTAFALAQPYIVKLTIALFLAARTSAVSTSFRAVSGPGP